MTLAALAVSPAELAIVRAILIRHAPGQEVWAFGSRVNGTSNQFSDLDLVIAGAQALPLAISASLAKAFSGSDLPYKVGPVDLGTTSDSFRSMIQQSYVVLQQPMTTEAAAKAAMP